MLYLYEFFALFEVAIKALIEIETELFHNLILLKHGSLLVLLRLAVDFELFDLLLDIS